MDTKLKDEAMGVHCEFVKMVSHTDFDESIHWAMKLGMPKDREHLPHAVVDRLAAIERGEETWPPERFQEGILFYCRFTKGFFLNEGTTRPKIRVR